MLVSEGFTRVMLPDGSEYTFQPSLGRIADLGQPAEILEIFRGLFGRYAAREARYVLATLCTNEDVTPLTGWHDEQGWHSGQLSQERQVVFAIHLLRHGLVGTAEAGKDEGAPAQEFRVSDYVAAARVHLGLSAADAEALSMTEFQALIEMKFPDAKKKKRDVPTREEYRAAMNSMAAVATSA